MARQGRSKARLNPHRRLLAKQAKALKDAKMARINEFDDTSLLQQGNVRSGLDKFRNKSGSLRAPRETWEGTGQRKRTSLKRFGQK